MTGSLIIKRNLKATSSTPLIQGLSGELLLVLAEASIVVYPIGYHCNTPGRGCKVHKRPDYCTSSLALLNGGCHCKTPGSGTWSRGDQTKAPLLWQCGMKNTIAKLRGVMQGQEDTKLIHIFSGSATWRIPLQNSREWCQVQKRTD